MKRLLAVLAAATLLFGLAVPAHATDYTMRGRVLAAYTAAGGQAKLGLPIEPEQKATISGRNLYWQHTQTADGTRSIVYWSSLQGGKDATQPDMIGWSGVSRERDAAARSTIYGDEQQTLQAGRLFRAAKLCGMTSRDKQTATAQLYGGVIIDWRTSGAASSCRDPYLSNVKNYRFPIDSSAAHDYRRYVKDAKIRASLGAGLKVAAAELANGDKVLFHCTAGKDRTGWAITIMLAIAGADQASIYREYLRGGSVSESDLVAALDQVATSYPEGADDHGVTSPGMYRYVTEGLGLTDAELAQIQQALAA